MSKIIKEKILSKKNSKEAKLLRRNLGNSKIKNYGLAIEALKLETNIKGKETTPKQNDHIILDKIETLMGEFPVFVNVAPVDFAEKQLCYGNVEKQVKQQGGSCEYGWKVWYMNDLYLNFEHHCVWNNGQVLIDITPQIEGEKNILFVLDKNTLYLGKPIANKIVCLSQNKHVQNYCNYAQKILTPEHTMLPHLLSISGEEEKELESTFKYMNKYLKAVK